MIKSCISCRKDLYNILPCQNTGLCADCRYLMSWGTCKSCRNDTVPPDKKVSFQQYQHITDCVVCYPVSTSSTTTVAIKPTSTDVSDWRAYRDQGRPDGECPCGIVQSMCDYHR